MPILNEMSASAHNTNRTILFLVFLVVALVTLLVYREWSSRGTGSKDEQRPTIVNLDEGDETYLRAEEGVLVPTASSTDEMAILPVDRVLFEYVEVIDSCGPHFGGECLRVRGGPGTEYPVVASVRNGMVLKVGGKVDNEERSWYKVVFDEWLRYPERMKGDWYLAADFVRILKDEGDRFVGDSDYATSGAKTITIDRSEQMLYAFLGSELFLETAISTGLELTPTPRGTFTIYKKTPSRYMQGPLPNLVDQQYYDLPGVPWNLYFTEGGAVIHGAYWHDSFGSRYSHGCVNLPTDVAHTLYTWAEIGTTVIVQD